MNADREGALTTSRSQAQSAGRGLSRREVLLAILASALSGTRASGTTDSQALQKRLEQLETDSGGRLGVAMLRVGTKEWLSHRGDERFALCSTFKLPLAALILRESELGDLNLDTFVEYGEADMVPYAPVTTKHLAEGGMTVGALAEAAQRTSDNVAANLLLRLLGGPEGFTQRLRSLGDDVTRLDRFEPEMNLVPPGEVRDTTSPMAMAQTVARFVSGPVLSPESGQQLRNWMEETRTGLRRLRAGLPEGVSAGDKTGTGIASGMANKYNDVAVVWPRQQAPIVIAAYFEADGEYSNIRPQDEAVLKEVGAIAALWSLLG